jgi:hypothetical protein
MHHVVYVDSKANELANLLSGRKTMIIRGAAGRKMPHGRVFENDDLFLIENDSSGLVKARGKVTSVIHSEKMTKEQSIALVQNNQDKLRLTDRQFERWAGKRYLVLVEVSEIQELEPFRIDRSAYGNMDDWLPVGDIESIKST